MISQYQRRDVAELAYLGVANEDEDGVGALRVEGVDLAGNGCDTLNDRVRVADAATGCLTTASGVGNHLSCRSGVRAEHRVDDGAGGTVAWRGGGLASTEHVYLRAALCGGESRTEKEDGSGAEHLDPGKLVSRLIPVADGTIDVDLYTLTVLRSTLIMDKSRASGGIIERPQLSC